MTPRSSRSAPAADPAAAPAAPSSPSHGLAATLAAGARAARPAARAQRRRRRPRARGPTAAEPSSRRRPRRPQDRAPIGRHPRRRVAGGVPGRGAREVFGDDWEPQLARLPGLPAPPADRRLRRRRVRLRPGDHRAVLMAALRPIAEKWFRIEVRGVENIPTEGGALVVSNHSGTVPVDGLMTMVIDPRPHRPVPAPARRRPGLPDAVRQQPWPARAAPPWPATRTPSGCWRRRAGRGLARGLQGHRQAVHRALQAPALRSRRLRRRRRCAPASRSCRCRWSAPRRSTRWSATSRRWPGCSACPTSRSRRSSRWLGPLGLVPLPSKWLLEFGEPIRTDEFDAGAADDPMLVFNVTDQVRETIQQTLYSLLMQRAVGLPLRRGPASGCAVADGRRSGGRSAVDARRCRLPTAVDGVAERRRPPVAGLTDGVEQVGRGVGDRRGHVGLVSVGQPVGEVLDGVLDVAAVGDWVVSPGSSGVEVPGSVDARRRQLTGGPGVARAAVGPCSAGRGRAASARRDQPGVDRRLGRLDEHARAST